MTAEETDHFKAAQRRYWEKQKRIEEAERVRLERIRDGKDKMSFKRKTQAWSSENLIKLDRLRNIEKPKKTYDQLSAIFNRTTEDIVNALTIIKGRKDRGLDPFKQIGTNEELERAKQVEQSRARRLRNLRKPKKKEEFIIVSEYHGS